MPELTQFLKDTGSLYVLAAYAAGDYPFLFTQTDGRLGFFTAADLAEKGKSAVESLLRIHTEILSFEGETQILEFLHFCLRNGYQVFRLDNGTDNMREIWLRELFPSWHEETLVEETNRSLKYLLLRSRAYGMELKSLPEEIRTGKQGRSLTEILLTVRYNAYREFFGGILYALADPAEGIIDYYTPAALDRARELLEQPENREKHFDFSSLIHNGNRGGEIWSDSKHLFYVNSPAEAGDPAKGYVAVFTDYDGAEKGLEQFERSNMPCSILALRGNEILSLAMQCAGLVIDMNTINFVIPKTDFSNVISFGELNGGILVSLNRDTGGESK